MNNAKMDQWFKDKNFLVLIPGEAYEYRLYYSVSIFVYKDPGKWVLYRYSPKYEKVIAEARTPQEIAKRTINYIEWQEKKKGRRKQHANL